MANLFPDLQTNIAQESTKGFKGIGQDLLSLIKQSPEMLEQLTENIIEGTPRQIEGLIQNPGRIPQGLLSGLMGAPHGIASIPPAIGDYLSQKDIISPETAQKIPRPPFSPHELAGLDEEMPGDVITGLFGNALAGGPATMTAAKTVGKGITKGSQAISQGSKALVNKGLEKASEGQLGQIYRGVSNQRTGEVLKDAYKADLEASRQMYSNVFNEADKLGVKNIPFDMKGYEMLSRHIPDKYVENFEKALKSGSFEDFHNAQSDLMKFSNKIRQAGETNPISVRRAAKMAGEAAKKIQANISRELFNKGGMDLLFDYVEAGKNYATNVVPWWNLPSIEGSVMNPGSPGFRYASNLPVEARMKTANPFLSGKGQQFPELAVNKMINSPLGRLMEALIGIGTVSKPFKE